MWSTMPSILFKLSLVIKFYVSSFMSLCNNVTSFIYNVYNSADSLLPCITEHGKDGKISELMESMDTYCVRLDKNDFMMFKHLPLMP